MSTFNIPRGLKIGNSQRKTAEAAAAEDEMYLSPEEDPIEEEDSSGDEISPLLPLGDEVVVVVAKEGEDKTIKPASSPNGEEEEEEVKINKCQWCGWQSAKKHSLPGHYGGCKPYKEWKSKQAAQNTEERVGKIIEAATTPRQSGGKKSSATPNTQKTLAEEAQEDAGLASQELFKSPGAKKNKGKISKEEQAKTDHFRKVLDAETADQMNIFRAIYLEKYGLFELAERALQGVFEGTISDAKARALLARKEGRRRVWTQGEEFGELQKFWQVEIYAITKEQQEQEERDYSKRSPPSETPPATPARPSTKSAVQQAEGHDKRKARELAATPGKEKKREEEKARSETQKKHSSLVLFTKHGESQTLRAAYFRDTITDKWSIPGLGQAEEEKEASHDELLFKMVNDEFGEGAVEELSVHKLFKGERSKTKYPGWDTMDYYAFVPYSVMEKMQSSARYKEARLLSRQEVGELKTELFTQDHTGRVSGALKKLLQGPGVKYNDYNEEDDDKSKIALYKKTPSPSKVQEKVVPLPTFELTGKAGGSGGASSGFVFDTQGEQPTREPETIESVTKEELLAMMNTTPLFAQFLAEKAGFVWEELQKEKKEMISAQTSQWFKDQEAKKEESARLVAAAAAKQREMIELETKQAEEENRLKRQEIENRLWLEKEAQRKAEEEQWQREEATRRAQEEEKQRAAAQAAKAVAEAAAAAHAKEEERLRKEAEELQLLEEAALASLAPTAQEKGRIRLEMHEEAERKRKFEEDLAAKKARALERKIARDKENAEKEAMKKAQEEAETVDIPDSPEREDLQEEDDDPMGVKKAVREATLKMNEKAAMAAAGTLGSPGRKSKVAVYIFNENDQVLMAGKKDMSTDSAGTGKGQSFKIAAQIDLKEGESPVAAAARAVFEGVGLHLPVASFVEAASLPLAAGHVQHELREFATGISSNLARNMRVANNKTATLNEEMSGYFLSMKRVKNLEKGVGQIPKRHAGLLLKAWYSEGMTEALHAWETSGISVNKLQLGPMDLDPSGGLPPPFGWTLAMLRRRASNLTTG